MDSKPRFLLLKLPLFPVQSLTYPDSFIAF